MAWSETDAALFAAVLGRDAAHHLATTPPHLDGPAPSSPAAAPELQARGRTASSGRSPDPAREAAPCSAGATAPEARAEAGERVRGAAEPRGGGAAAAGEAEPALLRAARGGPEDLQDGQGVAAERRIAYIQELEDRLRGGVGGVGAAGGHARAADRDSPAVEVKAMQDEVVLRVTTPLYAHPVSRVFHAIRDAQLSVAASDVAVADDAVTHTLVLRSPGPDQLTAETVLAAMSRGMTSATPSP